MGVRMSGDNAAEEYNRRVSFCPKCGAEIPNQLMVCPVCGRQLHTTDSNPKRWVRSTPTVTILTILSVLLAFAAVFCNPLVLAGTGITIGLLLMLVGSRDVGAGIIVINVVFGGIGVLVHVGTGLF